MVFLRILGTLRLFPERILFWKFFEISLHFDVSDPMMRAVALQIFEMPSNLLPYYPARMQLVSFY